MPEKIKTTCYARGGLFAPAMLFIKEFSFYRKKPVGSGRSERIKRNSQRRRQKNAEDRGERPFFTEQRREIGEDENDENYSRAPVRPFRFAEGLNAENDAENHGERRGQDKPHDDRTHAR